MKRFSGSVNRFHCLALLGLSLAAAGAGAVEIMKWERLPLAVPLTVGQERVIFLDKNVRVGMEGSLRQKLRVQSAGGALYLYAADEVAPTRLQVQVVDSGEIILLDIATIDGEAALEPVRIVDERSTPAASDEETAEQRRKEAEAREIPAPVALIRYAAQSLYAPLRTVEAVPGIRRMPLRVGGELALFPGTPVEARALAAFRLSDYTVTAVKLTHRGGGRVDLDPRRLQGAFYAATFQHPFLGPSSIRSWGRPAPPRTRRSPTS